MEVNQKTLLLLSLIFFAIGAMLPFYLDIGFDAPFPNQPVLGLTVFSLAVFVLSIFFFGYLSPALLLLYGMMASETLRINPVLGLAQLLPVVVAAYAGSILGTQGHKDLENSGNILFKWKRVTAGAALAAVIAIAVGLASPYIPGLAEIQALVAGVIPSLGI